MFNIYINLICYTFLAVVFDNQNLAVLSIFIWLVPWLISLFNYKPKCSQLTFDCGFKLTKSSFSKLRLTTFSSTLLIYIIYLIISFCEINLFSTKMLYVIFITTLVLPISLLYCLFYNIDRNEYYNSIFSFAKFKYLPASGILMGINVFLSIK